MAGLELAMYQSALEFVRLLQPCLMDAGILVMTASFPLPYFFIVPDLHTWGKPVLCLVQALYSALLLLLCPPLLSF